MWRMEIVLNVEGGDIVLNVRGGDTAECEGWR